MKGSYALKGLVSAEAGLRAYYMRLRRLRYRTPGFIVFSTVPKTGSTFLTRTIALLTKYEHCYLASAYKNIEQELYLPRLVDNYGKRVVVHQHFKANEPNLDLLREFSIYPVVLVRNIFDVLVSLRDHLNRDKLDNIPSLIPPKTFRSSNQARQLDYVIDFFAPWIIEYYVSWQYAESRGDVRFLWATYEELVADWPAEIARICKWLGLPRTIEQINSAINAAKTSNTAMSKFNKGSPGRGHDELTEPQMARVRSFAEYYPGINFSRIGL